MDKLIHDGRGVTISNDGATLIGLLDIVHPAAKTLVDIARSQDNQVGDGTTSVVLTAGELLKQSRGFIDEGMHSQIIIKGYRTAMQLCVDRINEISVKIADKEDAEKHQELLKQLAKSDRPDVTLQSQLNMKYEREVLDGMALAVQGLARVASFEHGGMLLQGVSDCDAVLKAVRGRVHAPVSIKKQMTQAEVLAELASRWPHEDWTTREEIAEEQCTLIAEAMQGSAKSRQQLYASDC